MDFYERIGVAALGSRVRRLGERLAEDAAQVCDYYGSGTEPRWFPVVMALADGAERSVTQVAQEIGHSHVSVSQIVRAMTKSGWLTQRRGVEDGRTTLVALSAKGRRAVPKLRNQIADVQAAVERLLGESGHDLWAAVAACERALDARDLKQRVARVREVRTKRAGRPALRVVDFAPRFAKAFREINLAWIERHFGVEESDRRQLDHPQVEILDRGGHILVAVEGRTPLGVVALVPHGEGCFELAKMGVAPDAQGRGIGETLLRAAIERARASGAERVYLESNTSLESAIRLYRRLGFNVVDGGASPYCRCNIQMELRLESAAPARSV